MKEVSSELSAASSNYLKIILNLFRCIPPSQGMSAPADTVVSKDAVVSTISYLYYLQCWHLWAQLVPPPNSLISHYLSPTLCSAFII